MEEYFLRKNYKSLAHTKSEANSYKSFEWDEEKDKENQVKHGVSFLSAQQAFFDPNRVIAEDTTHSIEETEDFLPEDDRRGSGPVCFT